MKVLNLYFSILLILCGFTFWGQELTPPIQNHSSIDYNAASQNWGIAIDDSGIIYAANNRGLLSFDGQQWELFPLKTGSIIRSVYPHQDRIYIGSYQEFGYWSRDNTGQMRYTSLMPLLVEYTMQSEEFWEILSFNNAIYFRSFGAIYKYDNDTIEPVKQVVSNKMVVYQGKLLIAVGKQGLFFLEEDGELQPLPGQEVLEGQTIIDVEVDGSNLWAGTRDALYFFDGKTCKLYENEGLNEQLKRFELNHIMKIPGKELVLATVKNGILYHDQVTGETRIFNRNNGLQNNTVLGMARKNGRIWLGLDNGIDEIDLDSPIEFFTDESGELGAVYDLVFLNDQTYLASNTGVYRLDDDDLQLIIGAEGHCWNLEVIDDVLYSNHNTGTYKVVNDEFVPVDNRTGSFHIQKSFTDQDSYLIGHYTGISTYNRKTGSLVELEDISFPVKKIIYENSSSLWAAHPYEGIYRIGLNEGENQSSVVQKIGKTDGDENLRSDIFRINNQIAILKDEQWYRYNSFSDSLEIFSDLRAYRNHKLLLEEPGGYWFANTGANSVVFTDFKDTHINISFQELKRRLVKDHENLIKFNDSLYYLNLNDGFARINLSSLRQAKRKEHLSKPIIRGISDAEKKYDLSLTPSIPFKNASVITILAALPVSDASALRYELIGENKLQGEVEKGTLKFQNLAHGEYQLNLFGLSPQNKISEVTSLRFQVNPPWYLSNLMKAVYVLILLSLIGLVYWFNKLKLNKHQWLLEQKFEKEHQERLNNLEKERLLNEITVKRKELANSTMVAAKKNEVLMEIQGELNKDRDKFSNQFRLKHIMNKINQAIKDKDEWKVFETNFNEVHEDFFKDLLDKYPRLSNKDLKLCSYLKMNLTSKEIAPLMGISVRGVEVHRYRLRKKMNLDSKENLTNFLIKNF